MPDRTSKGFGDSFSDDEWNRIGEALLQYCKANLTRLARRLLRGQRELDSDDIISMAVAKLLESLRIGKIPNYVPRLECRKWLVLVAQSCGGSDDPEMPESIQVWAANSVKVQARRVRPETGARGKVGGDIVSRRRSEAVRDDGPSPTDAFVLREALDHVRLSSRASFDLDPAARRRVQRLLKQYLDGPPKQKRRKLSPAPSPAHPSVDSLHFTVTSPSTLKAGSASIIDVWAHLAAQRGEVLSLACELRGRRQSIAGSKGPVPVTRGAQLSVQLRVPGCKVQPVEDSMLWDGGIANASFSLSVPKRMEPGTKACEAIVRIAGLSIARVAFVLSVGHEGGKVRAVKSKTNRLRRAFASYASKDRNAVLGRIQGMQKEAPNLDVFVDVARLKSGELGFLIEPVDHAAAAEIAGSSVWLLVDAEVGVGLSGSNVDGLYFGASASVNGQPILDVFSNDVATLHEYFPSGNPQVFLAHVGEPVVRMPATSTIRAWPS